VCAGVRYLIQNKWAHNCMQIESNVALGKVMKKWNKRTPLLNTSKWVLNIIILRKIIRFFYTKNYNILLVKWHKFCSICHTGGTLKSGSQTYMISLASRISTKTMFCVVQCSLEISLVIFIVKFSLFQGGLYCRV